MAALTFADLCSHNAFHGGAAHAAWCAHLMTCDGACTATATFETADGRTMAVTVTLPHNALWPTLTYAVDGQPVRFDPHTLTVAAWQALNRQVRAWNDSYAIPDLASRPQPAAGGAR